MRVSTFIAIALVCLVVLSVVAPTDALKLNKGPSGKLQNIRERRVFQQCRASCASEAAGDNDACVKRCISPTCYDSVANLEKGHKDLQFKECLMKELKDKPDA